MVLAWHLCLLAFYWHALASWQLSYVLAFLPGFGLLYQAYCGAIPCALWVSGLLLQLSVHIYVCLQFYSAQCSGCLAECCSVLVFFFPPTSTLAIIIVLISPLSPLFSVTSAWAGAGCGRQGQWLGCGQGRLLGCSCYLGQGLAAPAPWFLGTQPLCATQALMIKGQRILKLKKELIHLIKKINNNSYLYLLKTMSCFAMLCHVTFVEREQ